MISLGDVAFGDKKKMKGNMVGKRNGGER